jgi:Fe-S-cluster containining protein
VDLIDPKRVANEIPRGSIPECSTCEDICCRGIENVVSLRLRDIALLMDIDRTDLITKQKPRFPQTMMQTRPAIYELMGSELWLTLPVLRQLGDSRLCAALTSEMKCGIYPNWPLSCSRFPYTLIASSKKVVWGTRCPSKKRDLEASERSDQLFDGAVQTYNERIRDAVLLAHARPQLEKLGIGEFLSDPRLPEFEEQPDRLPLYFE